MIIEALGGTITYLNINIVYVCHDILQCMIDYNIPKLCIDGFCYLRIV